MKYLKSLGLFIGSFLTSNIIMSILLVAILSFISIGYAIFSQSLGFSGNTALTAQGEIEITDVTLVSSVNVKPGSVPAYTSTSVDFNLTFEKPAGATQDNYQAVYSISIANNTFYRHEFSLGNFQPIITNSQGIDVDPSYLTITLDGIELGDMIPAGETVTFTLTFDFDPPEDDTYSVGGELEPELELYQIIV